MEVEGKRRRGKPIEDAWTESGMLSERRNCRAGGSVHPSYMEAHIVHRPHKKVGLKPATGHPCMFEQLVAGTVSAFYGVLFRFPTTSCSATHE